MKHYYPEKIERRSILTDLILRFEEKSSLHYSLPDSSSLILTKDERSLNHLRRYKDSPFPLLSNIELFSCSVGDYHKDLLLYGLKIRLKAGEDPTYYTGTNVFLVNQFTPNYRGNRYLKKQYKLCTFYRDEGYLRLY